MRILGSVFLIVIIQCGVCRCCNAQIRSGGFMPGAAAFATASRFSQNLAYSDEDRNALREVFRRSLKDPRVREINRRIRRFAALDLETHFDRNLIGSKDEATEFNNSLLEPVEGVLSDKKRIRRFRQIMTQLMLWSGDLDGVVRYNDLKLDFKEYEGMWDLYGEEKARIPSQELLEYRAALPYLINLVGKSSIDSVVGEEFHGGLNAEKGTDQDGPVRHAMKLLSISEVQKELSLTLAQMKRLSSTTKSLANLARTAEKALYDASSDDDKKKIAKSETHIRHQLENQLSDFLDDSQMIRFTELTFQRQIRALQLKDVLSRAGFQDEAKEISNQVIILIQTEANFVQQIQGLNAGFIAIEHVTDDRTAVRICGKPVIERDGTRYLDPKGHDELMQAVRKRIPFVGQHATGKERNPRRGAN